MSTNAEIKRLLKEIIGVNTNCPFIGKVLEVQDQTCTIQVNDLDIPDVRLRSSINEDVNFFILKPKIGCNVTVISLTGDLDDLCVIKIDEVETLEFKQDGLHILVDSTDKKVQIKNQQTSLYDLFSDLSSILEQFKVFTPSGPSSGVLPDSIVSITQFKTSFKQLLK